MASLSDPIFVSDMETGSIDWRRYYKLVCIECLNIWCKCEIATIGLIELLGHSDGTYSTVTELISENAPNLRTVILGEFPNLVKSASMKTDLENGKYDLLWARAALPDELATRAPSRLVAILSDSLAGTRARAV